MHKKTRELKWFARKMANAGYAVKGGSNGGGWQHLAKLLGVRVTNKIDARVVLVRRFGIPGNDGWRSGPVEVVYSAKLAKKNDGFYETDEWRSVRYRALKLHGGRCQCCGAGAAQGKILHVDHIKPRSKFPELALTLENLQVLCEDCNLGKSNKDDTDWRPKLVVDNPTPTRRIGIRD